MSNQKKEELQETNGLETRKEKQLKLKQNLLLALSDQSFQSELKRTKVNKVTTSESGVVRFSAAGTILLDINDVDLSNFENNGIALFFVRTGSYRQIIINAFENEDASLVIASKETLLQRLREELSYFDDV